MWVTLTHIKSIKVEGWLIRDHCVKTIAIHMSWSVCMREGFKGSFLSSSRDLQTCTGGESFFKKEKMKYQMQKHFVSLWTNRMGFVNRKTRRWAHVIKLHDVTHHHVCGKCKTMWRTAWNYASLTCGDCRRRPGIRSMHMWVSRPVKISTVEWRNE